MKYSKCHQTQFSSAKRCYNYPLQWQSPGEFKQAYLSQGVFGEIPAAWIRKASTTERIVKFYCVTTENQHMQVDWTKIAKENCRYVLICLLSVDAFLFSCSCKQKKLYNEYLWCDCDFKLWINHSLSCKVRNICN